MHRVHKVKTIFTKCKYMWHWTSGKTAGILTWIKSMAPKSTKSHVLHCTHSHTHIHKQILSHLRRAMMKQLSIIHFLKSQPWNTWLFKILYNKMGSIYKTFWVHYEVTMVVWSSGRKALCTLWAASWNYPLFTLNIIFTWKADWQSLLWTLRNLASMFSKMRWICHFKKNNWQYL